MQDLYQPTRPLPSLHSKTGAQKTNAFEIHALEKTIKDGNHAPGIKDWCKIIWIKDGSGAFCLDTNKYAISSNTIYCIKRDQTVTFHPDDRATGYAISFSADFLAVGEDHTESFHHTALFHPLSLFSIIKVGEKQLSEMLEIAEKMVLESENDYSGKEDILRGLLKIFLLYLNRHQEQSPRPATTLNQIGLASSFFILLEKNFASKKMVSAYARDLHVTANYLNETIKKASGSPASYHIQQRIILEAKRKARHVRTSMKEIAYGLGFADLAHFSKYFKRASGVNFTDFKKELSGQFRFATPKC
jgi:AraC family transcriptional regulator, transcriptional activator of pobA